MQITKPQHQALPCAEHCQQASNASKKETVVQLIFTMQQQFFHAAMRNSLGHKSAVRSDASFFAALNQKAANESATQSTEKP